MSDLKTRSIEASVEAFIAALEDIDLDVLRELVRGSVSYLSEKYGNPKDASSTD